MPAFAERLLKDIKLIPMWSCICRDKFGYGRVPASSASVESDFNIIKNIFLKTEQTPMRTDEFITKHMSFINGRIKLINVNLQDKEKNREDVTESVNDIEISTMDNVNKNVENECPACRNGDQPSGAHVCYICRKNVHALDACSAPVGEEGYGQKRICKNCQKTDNQNIIASREVEDWHGLAATESQGRYLQGKSIENEFLLDKNIRKIPIIKNGGNLSIKAVKFGKTKYSFTNTCAFDSILQLFIAAYLDKDKVKDLINNECNNIFFKLICDMVHFGVRKLSYRLRAEILINIFSGNTLPNNCILIDCQVTIGFLCNKLFAKYPTFREVSRCSKLCAERLKVLPIVNIEIDTLIQKDFVQLEKDITLQPQRCCKTNCNGLEITSIIHTGIDLILLVLLITILLLLLIINENLSYELYFVLFSGYFLSYSRYIQITKNR